MTNMPSSRFDDLTFSEADRCHEVARILAAGLLRLRVRAASQTEQIPGVKNLPESAQDCLDVSAGTALNVSHGS
jgi:hypothetical protein